MSRTLSKFCMAWVLLMALHVALCSKWGHQHEHSNKLARHRRNKGLSRGWPTKDFNIQHFKSVNERQDNRRFENERFRRNKLYRNQFYRKKNSYSGYFEFSRFRTPDHLREARSLKSNEIIGNDFPPLSNKYSPEFDVFDEERSLIHNNVEMYSVDDRTRNNEANVLEFPKEDIDMTSSISKEPRLVPKASIQNLDSDQPSASGSGVNHKDHNGRNGTRQRTKVTAFKPTLSERSTQVVDCQDYNVLGKLLHDIAGHRPIDSLSIKEVISHRLVAENPQFIRCFEGLSSDPHIRRGTPVKRNSGESPLSWADLLKSITPSTTPTPPKKKRGRGRGSKGRNREVESLFDGVEISTMPDSREGGFGQAKKLVTIYNKLGGTSLQIRLNGAVRGTRDLDVYCIFRITYLDSRSGLIAKIKGEKSKLYLAMRDNGSLYATSDPTDTNTSFRHDDFPHSHDAFQSVPHGNYVALSFNGRPSKKIFSSSIHSEKTQFLRRNPELKLIEALSDETIPSSAAPSNGKECKKGSKCHRPSGKSKKKKRKKKKRKNKKKCRSKKCRTRRRNKRREKKNKRTRRSVSKSVSRATSTDQEAKLSDGFKSRRRLNGRARKRRKFRNFLDKNDKKMISKSLNHTT